MGVDLSKGVILGVKDRPPSARRRLGVLRGLYTASAKQTERAKAKDAEAAPGEGLIVRP